MTNLAIDGDARRPLSVFKNGLNSVKIPLEIDPDRLADFPRKTKRLITISKLREHPFPKSHEIVPVPVERSIENNVVNPVNELFASLEDVNFDLETPVKRKVFGSH